MADSAPTTPEEYLVWEERQEFKWEFDGARAVAMPGASAAHSTIQGNLITALRTRLRGGRFLALGPSMRVPTGGGRYRYPDALAVPGPIPGNTRDVHAPTVLFEVLDAGGRSDARTLKLVEYRQIASLQRYVMLEQDQALATVITRTDTGWAIDVLREGDGLAMPEIGIEIPMTELYLDVGLPATPA